MSRPIDSAPDEPDLSEAEIDVPIFVPGTDAVVEEDLPDPVLQRGPVRRLYLGPFRLPIVALDFLLD